VENRNHINSQAKPDGRCDHPISAPARHRTFVPTHLLVSGTSAQGTLPSAKVTFDILVNGAPHVSYVFPGMEVATPKHGDVLSVSGLTGAGPLTVTVTKNGRMAYTIAPYEFGDLSCTSVTYPGYIS
jgi:hypothetical protein